MTTNVNCMSYSQWQSSVHDCQALSDRRLLCVDWNANRCLLRLSVTVDDGSQGIELAAEVLVALDATARLVCHATCSVAGRHYQIPVSAFWNTFCQNGSVLALSTALFAHASCWSNYQLWKMLTLYPYLWQHNVVTYQFICDMLTCFRIRLWWWCCRCWCSTRVSILISMELY